MPVHLLWGMGSEGSLGVSGPDHATNYRPVIATESNIPFIDPDELVPGSKVSGENVAKVISEGEDQPSILTDDLRPRILDVEEEE